MYESFFGLRERPFDLTPNPRFLVLTEGHREALSNLEYGIASRRGITLMMGEAGTGKTTLIRAALQRQPAHVHCVHLQNPALTRPEFVEMLAIRFELSDRARVSKTALLTELESTLQQRAARGESTVLLVDEAQSLSLELLEELRLLGNIETEESKLMSIVLAGQPELAGLLDRDSLRQLKQRIALRCVLRPLTQVETAGYLAGRIRAAGGVGAQVFTREAVMLIHDRSGGVPRIISVIAENTLLTAFALNRKPVNSEIVHEVCRDLSLSELSADVRPDLPPLHAARAGNFTAFQLRSVLTQEPPVPITAEQDPKADDDSSMFSNYPKRRRFSLFSKSGSR